MYNVVGKKVHVRYLIKKPSKDDGNKMPSTSFMNRKSESNVKTQKHFAKNGCLADVSDCKQWFRRLCCETLNDLHIQGGSK